MVALALSVAGAGARPLGAESACGPQGEHSPLGLVAFVRGGALVVYDLDRCAEQVLVPRGVAGPVAWSADGTWISAGPRVVHANGVKVIRPFADAVAGVTWAPTGHVLAAVTARGGLLVGGPGTQPRRLLPDGWGASGAMYAQDGSLAVSRDLRADRRPLREEVWLLRPPAWRPRLVRRLPAAADTPPTLAAVAPDAHAILYWPFVDHANSANLDGLPLVLVPVTGGAERRITPSMLATTEYLAWCGRRLVVASGSDRMATLHKSLLVAAPPAWRPRLLAPAGARSWISPSCSANGRVVAAAAGPNREDVPFGREARSIWLLPVTRGPRVRLTPPPPRGRSDELPRLSADGRFVLFVRSGPTDRDAGAPGRLYLVETGGAHRLFGPLASLGRGGNYYGRYGWGTTTAWYRPAARR